VTEVFTTSAQTILVMDYVEGEELFHCVSKHKDNKVDEHTAARYIAQLFSAISYLHHRGVVHRDIKLENIMLTHQGEIKLIDFGFSKRIGDKRVLNSCCGSPNYMSPEMLRSTRTQDQSVLPTKHSKYGREVDIWAAGVAMYVLLVGKYPFYDERRSHWHRSILQGNYAVPSTMSEEARDLLSKVLNVDSEARYTADQAIAHPWLREVHHLAPASCGGNINSAFETPVRRKTPPHAVDHTAAAATAAFTPPHNLHSLCCDTSP
jgi:serine/threonine protein kinase